MSPTDPIDENDFDLAKDQVDRLSQRVMRDMDKLRQLKVSYPELRVGFYPAEAGSILNAYREGDLAFDEAVRLLDSRSTQPSKLDRLEDFFEKLIDDAHEGWKDAIAIYRLIPWWRFISSREAWQTVESAESHLNLVGALYRAFKYSTLGGGVR